MISIKIKELRTNSDSIPNNISCNELPNSSTLKSYMLCQDNECSLVDSLIFNNLQDYRYRTINRCINCYHMDEFHVDVAANIALVVEREKMVLSAYSRCVNIEEIISLSSGILEA